MSKKTELEETWDADIPSRLNLIEGEEYKLKIETLDWAMSRFGKPNLRIETDQGTVITGAWNMINFLRANKPVKGRTLCFRVTGTGIARRFHDIKLE